MGSSVQPERKRLSRADYDVIRGRGYSDDQIRAKGYDLPEDETAGPLSFEEKYNIPDVRKNTIEDAKTLGRLALTGAQGIPFAGPLSDEMLGTAYGALDPNKTMQEGRDAVRGQIRQSREEHPFLSFAAETAASGWGLGQLAKKAPEWAVRFGLKALPEGASLVERMKKGAKGVALLGGTTGFGASEGSVTDRLPGAAAGTLLGAVVGGLVPPVSEAAKYAGGKVAGLVRAGKEKFLDARDPARIASKMLKSSLDADKVDLAQRAANATPDATLLDASGKYTQGLIKGSQRVPTQAGTDFDAFLARREAGREGAAARAFAEGTGVAPGEGNRTVVSEITDMMKPDIRAAYANVEPSQIKDARIAQLLRNNSKAMRKVLGVADEYMREKYGRGLPVDDKGRYAVEKITSVETLNEIKKAMDDVGKIVKRKPAKGLEARSWARQLTQYLDEATGGSHGEARALAQEPFKVAQATDIATKAARRGDVRDLPLDLKKLGRGAAPGANELIPVASREAVARELMQKLQQAGSEGQRLGMLLESPAMVETARAAFPDQRSFDRFASTAKTLLEKALRDEAVRGNARAASLLSDPDTFSRLTPWAIAQAMSGSWSLAAAQALGSVEATTLRKAQERAAPEILRLAQSPLGGEDVQRMIAEWARMNAPAAPSGIATAIRNRPRLGKPVGQAIVNRLFTPASNR